MTIADQLRQEGMQQRIEKGKLLEKHSIATLIFF